MVESQSDLGKQFVIFKNLIAAGQGPQIMAHLNQELNKASATKELDSIRGQYRMFVSFIV